MIAAKATRMTKNLTEDLTMGIDERERFKGTSTDCSDWVR
jgi:hypothetical protein